MAETNDELKMINHLLDVEKDANGIVAVAMEEAGKKVEAARAKYNEEYKQKIDIIIEELKEKYESSVQSVKDEHEKQIDDYRKMLESKNQDYKAFSKLLDTLVFESQ